MTTVTVLIVAKAPIPGHAKTRLALAVGEDAAADIAAAALLDTLDTVAGTPIGSRVVALEGDLTGAARSAELREMLGGFHVIAQRGQDFAARLANAHADAAGAAGGGAVLQIGMDTPQVTAELLMACVGLLDTAPAVLGPARDGGWWALGVRDAALAGCLADVPMSRPDTGALTIAALTATGARVALASALDDVDTIDDVPRVRSCCSPSSRFVHATKEI